MNEEAEAEKPPVVVPLKSLARDKETGYIGRVTGLMVEVGQNPTVRLERLDDKDNIQTTWMAMSRLEVVPEPKA